MPHSLRENDELVRDFVSQQGISTVLDVGAGSGTYARLLKECTLDAVEVWEPYIAEFDLTSLYRSIYVDDIRHMAHSNDWNHSYDLVIFGDVLEHMTEDEALTVWTWAHKVATWGLISLPIVHWPQDATENPYEAHVQEHVNWQHLLKRFGPFTGWQLYQQTGTFIKEF